MSITYRFVLADDDPDVLFLAQNAIEEFYPGSSFASFSNAEDALQHILRMPIDILITDHGMGVMSGTELIRVLRQREFKLPIIMVSGHEQKEQEAKEAGANVFLTKARAYSALVEAIKKLLPPP
jgi:CheY-like chemotaxis protein